MKPSAEPPVVPNATPTDPAPTPQETPPRQGRGLRRRRSLGWRVTKILLVAALLLAVMGAIAAGTALFTYYQMAGNYDLAKISQIPSRSEVFDADGALYARIENVNRAVVPLKDVSPWFRKAIVSREDERFFSHTGVDFQAIARALVRDVSHRGGRREGGSTITQQLARNSFPLGGQRSYHRKLLEAMVAERMERQYSKEQILECYVNRIYLGAGVYGIETAAQRYFGKPAKDLTLSESALLAGIVRSPNTNSPFKNLKGALSERDSVLERMAFLKELTPEQVTEARQETPRLTAAKPLPQQRDWLMDAVRAQLDDLIGSEDLDLGGLKIYTTLDPRLQKVAERAVETRLDKIEASRGYGHPTRADWLKTRPPGGDKQAEGDSDASPDYLQAALLAVDNKTGAVRAMVGGRNYEESAFNRAWLSKRQIGSTFKPFVFAAAFAKGMSASQLVEDTALRPDEIKDADPNWQPANSDGEFLGPQPADLALIQSRNVMTIRVGEWAGRDAVHRLAAEVGLLGEKTPALPSIYLGAFETTVKAVVGAYTVFPNKGLVRTPYVIERIDAADGDTLFQAKHETPRPITESAAQTTSDLLERVMTEGTAKTAASLGLKAPAAGKTGTTNDFKDAWFLGYTTSLTCGVWVGLDKPQTIMAKGYGAALALPIWVDVMQAAAQVENKRYPALALHTGPLAGSLPRAQLVTAADGAAPVAPLQPFLQGNNATAVNAVPPPLPSVATAPPRPTAATSNDPGSRLIVNPQTGQVVGIDGSAGAARDEQARVQQQQQLLEQQRQQRLLQEQSLQTQVPGSSAPVQGVPRAQPVGPPPVTATTTSAPPVTSSATVPVRRAQAVAPESVPPAPAALPTRGANAPVDPNRVRTRIITLPDGTQVVQRTTVDPLAR